MNLEIINRVSPQIKQEKQARASVAMMRIHTEKELRFTTGAMKAFGLEKGKYIHFGREKGRWYFVINTINTGFLITHISAKLPMGGGCRVNSAPLVALILKSTKKKITNNFYLQKTESEHNSCPVIEILTGKTVQEIYNEA